VVEPTPQVRDLAPYAPSRGATIPDRDCLRLDWNEATWPPSPRVAEALQRVIVDGLNRYPDVSATALRAKLGAYTGAPADHIRVYNGSDAALRDICAAFLGEGDPFYTLEPTYTQFAVFAHAAGGERARRPEDARMIYRPNPNNPDGDLLGTGDIEFMCEDAPGALIVIDEAYYEFAGVTAVPLVAQYDNLIVTRSFSKAFALAGMRAGYVIAQPALLAWLDRIRNGKDVSALAQVAACAALDDLEYMYAHVDEVIRAQAWAVGELARLGVAAQATMGNWILVRVADPGGFCTALAARGILVRDRDALMPGVVRVSVGTHEDMARFVGAVKEVLGARIAV